MADIQKLKEQVQSEIDTIAPQLISCSDWMADNPEIGLEEYQASARLAAMLEESGAAVERGIAELPTAFSATLARNSSGEPVIAILAEYDALPEVGHGCGHNIIGNAAATKSERGHAALIAAAKTLAMSTLDLLGAPDLLARAKREHQTAVGPLASAE